MRRVVIATLIALVGIVLVPIAGQAHVERPSYWPDPKPDCSVATCAGGAVPKARSLRSALDEGRRGTTRVVCKSNSLQARQAGRPSRARPPATTSVRPTTAASAASEPAHFSSINQRLFQRCAYHQIQRRSRPRTTTTASS